MKQLENSENNIMANTQTTAKCTCNHLPLTDEEIAKIASTPAAVVGSYVHTFARAIEAAHGIGEKK